MTNYRTHIAEDAPYRESYTRLWLITLHPVDGYECVAFESKTDTPEELMDYYLEHGGAEVHGEFVRIISQRAVVHTWPMEEVFRV